MFCASDSIKAANTWKKTLLSFRYNEYFETMFNIDTEICELELLKYIKCIQKTLKLLQYTNNSSIKLTSKYELLKDMFKTIDYLTNEIDRRFD